MSSKNDQIELFAPANAAITLAIAVKKRKKAKAGSWMIFRSSAQNSLLQYSSLHSLHLGQLSRQLLQPPVGSNTDVGET